MEGSDELVFRSVAEVGCEVAVEVARLGFSDYLVRIPFDARMLESMVRVDSVELDGSWIAYRAGAPVGIVFGAHRRKETRVVAMATVPAARGCGVGRQLLERLVTCARARGDTTVCLEVIARNTGALRLYEKFGFERIRRLFGYESHPRSIVAAEGPPLPVALPEESDAEEALKWARAHRLPGLPWQISPENLLAAVDSLQAFHNPEAVIFVSGTGSAGGVVRGIATTVTPSARGGLSELLRGLVQRFPETTWRASALFPEEWEAAFADAGWRRSELNQWQMCLRLP